MLELPQQQQKRSDIARCRRSAAQNDCTIRQHRDGRLRHHVGYAEIARKLEHASHNVAIRLETLSPDCVSLRPDDQITTIRQRHHLGVQLIRC